MDYKTENMIRTNFEEALNNFDFTKVNSIMTFLDWEWSGKNGMHVPSIVEMIRWVEELLNNAISLMDNGYSVVGGGGFDVEIFNDNNVEISFVLTSSKSYNETILGDNTVG
jgi:hypothetical protein